MTDLSVCVHNKDSATPSLFQLEFVGIFESSLIVKIFHLCSPVKNEMVVFTPIIFGERHRHCQGSRWSFCDLPDNVNIIFPHKLNHKLNTKPL